MVWCRAVKTTTPRARRHYRSPAAGEKNNKNKRLFSKQSAYGDEQQWWRLETVNSSSGVALSG